LIWQGAEECGGAQWDEGICMYLRLNYYCW